MDEVLVLLVWPSLVRKPGLGNELETREWSHTHGQIGWQQQLTRPLSRYSRVLSVSPFHCHWDGLGMADKSEDGTSIYASKVV